MIKKISFSPVYHFDKEKINIPKNDFAKDKKDLEDKLRKFYNKSFAILTNNGREAISLLAKELFLKPKDEVFITTSYNYPNVSSCVTSTIFNYCKPSRIFSRDTKAIFVIHEFGVPHPNLFSLKELANKVGIPLIEDCAHTIDSCYDNKQPIGFIGDFVIISFPKIFPVDYGGALIGNNIFKREKTRCDLKSIKTDIQLTNAIFDQVNAFSITRRELFSFFWEEIKSTSLQSLISPNVNYTPWFFPVISQDPKKLLSIAKLNQIDAGLWHGSNVVVLPLHQYLEKRDIQYIVDVLRSNKAK